MSRPSFDFKRPGLPQTSSRIQASKILNVDQPGGDATNIAYSPRTAWRGTPGLTQNPLLSLTHPKYDLPETLVQNFLSLGIRSIYPWQSSCLLGRGLLTGEKNLVYSAPTGGGKSLVADVLMLKRIIDHPEKKAILVLPYVALVQEKLKWLRRIVEGVHKRGKNNDSNMMFSQRERNHGTIRVAGFYGGSKTRQSLADIDIAVCTIEKANAMLNTAIEDHSITTLGVLVLDELHMLQDDHRGYLMELMATKIMSLEHEIQVIGMSATLSVRHGQIILAGPDTNVEQNTEIIAKWLDAKYYESKYRPIPIEEYLVFENGIYPASSSSAFLKKDSESDAPGSSISKPRPCRTITLSEHAALKSPLVNAVAALASETVRSEYGTLIFCSSRKGCELDATLVSEVMPTAEELDQDIIEARREVLSELRSTSVGLDGCLENTIPCGVAFHHAGLTTEERDIVAQAFDNGVIKVIVATCSLAAGINLPARRVILHGARMGRDFVGPALLRQMRGRAGRKGKDEIGETYLCCQKSDLEAVAQLLEADLPVVESCLVAEKRGVNRALLEVIGTRLATSEEAIGDHMRRTLLHHVSEVSDLSGVVRSTLDYLISASLIAAESEGTYKSTQLGHAIVAASISPEDGLFIHEEIQRALRAFVMDGEMHIFYIFTPIQSSALGDINWKVYRDEVDQLDESGIRVLNYVGINPGTINILAQGGSLKETTSAEINIARVYRRFYAALQLRDLCNETPVYKVARKYDIPRGAVQNLAQTCDGFAAGMIKFCERMGWGMLAAVLEHTSDRLKAGARAELLDLARITFVKSRTARVLWENGLKTVRAVADADPKDLIPILLEAQPKKLRLHSDEEKRYREKVALKADIIINSANRLWSQQMQMELDDG
ncbi:MAG: hypothetical protein M1816_006115 [Peltula sp. TS41687]|nr:MAG: hypothetical protein M1816_006115 [Peltula sp. TS41687]